MNAKRDSCGGVTTTIKGLQQLGLRQTFSIKVVLGSIASGDFQIRRFRLGQIIQDGNIVSLEKLISLLKKVTGFSKVPTMFSYKDKEGDDIRISTSQELQTAIFTVRVESNKTATSLKIFTVPEKTKQAAPTSSFGRSFRFASAETGQPNPPATGFLFSNGTASAALSPFTFGSKGGCSNAPPCKRHKRAVRRVVRARVPIRPGRVRSPPTAKSPESGDVHQGADRSKAPFSTDVKFNESKEEDNEGGVRDGIAELQEEMAELDRLFREDPEELERQVARELDNDNHDAPSMIDASSSQNLGMQEVVDNSRERCSACGQSQVTPPAGQETQSEVEKTDVSVATESYKTQTEEANSPSSETTKKQNEESKHKDLFDSLQEEELALQEIIKECDGLAQLLEEALKKADVSTKSEQEGGITSDLSTEDTAKEVERLKEELVKKEKENAKIRSDKDKLETYIRKTLDKFQDKYLVALQECKAKLREKQDKIEALENRSATEKTAQKQEERLISSTIYELGLAIMIPRVLLCWKEEPHLIHLRPRHPKFHSSGLRREELTLICSNRRHVGPSKHLSNPLRQKRASVQLRCKLSQACLHT